MHHEHEHHNHHEHSHTQAHQHSHGQHDKHAGHDPTMFKQKFWLSLLLTIPTLVFSHTVQSWFGIRWEFPGSEYIPAIFGTVIFFYGGLVFLKSAKIELSQRQPGMMTLISMAITVAFGYSLASTFGLVEGMDFWWELATLVAIMLLGHWLEMASVHNAQGALDELAKLLPDEAELINGHTVPLDHLKVGDLLLVRPGSRIPIDGTVTKGESSVNESMITGESKPVHKHAGADVIGGTVNGSGALTVTVTRTGDSTALAGIVRLVAEAQQTKSKTQILADKAAFYLTFIALGAALLTWIGWAWAGESAGFILERVVTVLVVACPHALGLAIPLVAAISTTKAARQGLLVRQRLALEAARNIDVILFDKTGTLTTGEQGVIAVIADNENEILQLAASVEQQSEHPIAKAIVAAAQKKRLSLYDTTKFSALSGRGVTAYVHGSAIHVGGPQLVTQLGIEIKAPYKKAAKDAAANGQAIVYVITSNTITGAIIISDVIRPESKQAVTLLQSAGKRVAMITGDSQGVAAWVATKLGLDEYYAEILPEHKAHTVKALQASGKRVAMVGDGVNDAPALAQADIGIAIGAGTDVAIESADIVIASSDPRDIIKIIHLSRATYTKMLQNLLWAAGYNAVAIPLAAGVTATAGFILSPAFGAVLMSLSTIIVAINAQFLRTIDVSDYNKKEEPLMKREALLYGIGGIALGMLIAWSIVIWTADTAPDRQKEMSMSSMQTDLERKSGEDFDKQYLEMMIAHHQSAVDMAKLAKNHAARPEIKDLSKEVITQQSKEIDTMQSWQKAWGYPISSTLKMSH